MKRSFVYLLFFPALFITFKGVFFNEIQYEEPKLFYINPDIINYFDSISKILILSITVLFILIYLINYFVKEDQNALLNVYFPLINITWFLSRFFAIIIIAIFLFLITVLFNYVIPQFKPTQIYLFIIITLFLSGLAAAWTILSIVNKFGKTTAFKVHGFPITEEDQPELIDLIKSLSKKINSIFPDNIILTSETQFFVTSANLRLYNYKYEKLIKGNTLCIPLLIFKVLSKDELSGVIGHELAHFSGEDTKYSIKYSKTTSSLRKIFKEFKSAFSGTKYDQATEWGFYFIIRFFLIMIFFPMVFLYENLIEKNKLNLRNRELRADKIGSSVCKNKKNFITGLCKFCIYRLIWTLAEYEIFDKRKSIKTQKTLTKEFIKFQTKYHENFDPGKDLKKIMNFEMIHPSDDHPSILNRAKNLNIDVKKFNKKDLTDSTDLSISFIKNYDFVDKELTSL